MSDSDSFLYLFSRLQDELNRLINEFIEHEGRGSLGDVGAPNVDVLETDDTVELLVELPGVRREDLKIECAGKLVTVAGQRSTSSVLAAPGARFERVERPSGAFRRQIELDRTVHSGQATACLERGVLRISFPRITDQRARVQEIPIQEITEEEEVEP